MADSDKISAPTEVAIRTEFSERMQTVERRYRAEVAKTIKKRNFAIGAAAAAGVLLLAPLALLAATTAVSLALAGLTIVAFIAGGYYAKIRLPLWIKKGHDAVQLELLIHANGQKELIQNEMNRALAARKTLARANPIDQLQNYMIEKGNRLISFKSAVSQIGGQVKTMGDMLADRKTGKPNKDYTKKEEALAAMTAAYEGLRRTAKQGDAAITELREIIEDQKFDWKFAQAGKSAMQNLRAMNGQDLLNEVLAGESFDEVRENFNKVFSDIEIEIGNINSGKPLTYGEGNDGMTLDMSAIHFEEPQVLLPKQGENDKRYR